MTPMTMNAEDAHDTRNRSARADELSQRRIDALVAFISFSLMLTILGLVFFALETWHA